MHISVSHESGDSYLTLSIGKAELKWFTAPVTNIADDVATVQRIGNTYFLITADGAQMRGIRLGKDKTLARTVPIRRIAWERDFDGAAAVNIEMLLEGTPADYLETQSLPREPLAMPTKKGKSVPVLKVCTLDKHNNMRSVAWHPTVDCQEVDYTSMVPGMLVTESVGGQASAPILRQLLAGIDTEICIATEGGDKRTWIIGPAEAESVEDLQWFALMVVTQQPALPMDGDEGDASQRGQDDNPLE